MAATSGNTRRLGRPPGRTAGETRTRLLDAALELFAARGFEATTVREIADRVGVRDSAIYAHFRGKQEIYDALLGEMGPVSLEALDLDRDELTETSPAQAIHTMVGRLLDAWCAPRALLFASVLLREGAGHGGFRGLSDLIGEAVAKLAGPFERWQTAGLLRADLTASQLVWELFAPLHVARFLHLRAGAADADLAAARRLADAHVAFFLTCCTRPERSR